MDQVEANIYSNGGKYLGVELDAVDVCQVVLKQTNLSNPVWNISLFVIFYIIMLILIELYKQLMIQKQRKHYFTKSSHKVYNNF